MKKKLFAMAVVAMMTAMNTIVLTSCSNDDNVVVNTDQTVVPIV